MIFFENDSVMAINIIKKGTKKYLIFVLNKGKEEGLALLQAINVCV